MNMIPRIMRPKEIDGLIEPPGKAYARLTGNMITGNTLWSESAQENGLKSPIRLLVNLIEIHSLPWKSGFKSNRPYV